MDTSETYKKMCEKAEEIRGCAKNIRSDFEDIVSCYWAYYKKCKCGRIYNYSDKYCSECGSKLKSMKKRQVRTGQTVPEDFIWLPRQDQLQEMLKDGLSTGIFGHTSRMVCYFEEHYKYRNSLGIDNMEHLWLAFVMKEKFFKIWSKSSGEWINEK